MADFQSYAPDIITAAGSDQSGATLLTYHASQVSTDTDSKGVKLPLLSNQGNVLVQNTGSGFALKVYPNTDEFISGTSGTNIATYLPSGSLGFFQRLTNSRWGVIRSDLTSVLGSKSASGTNQSTATALSYGWLNLSISTALNTGVRLPVYDSVFTDIKITIYNNSVEILRVYPGSGDAIVNFGTNVAAQMLGHKTAVFQLVGANLWSILLGS